MRVNHNEASYLGSLIAGVCPVSAISGRTQQKCTCDGQTPETKQL